MMAASSKLLPEIFKPEEREHAGAEETSAPIRVFGVSTTASAEKGKAVFEAVVNELVRMLIC
jgi:creatinine amidohydrolase/Fe(II)-dependent formamide hydrolase-like protein